MRFYSILSMQIVAISCLNSLNFISKANGMYNKRNYLLFVVLIYALFWEIRNRCK